MKRLKYFIFALAGITSLYACSDDVNESAPEINDPQTATNRLELISISDNVVIRDDGRSGLGQFAAGSGNAEILIDSDASSWSVEPVSPIDWLTATITDRGFVIDIEPNGEEIRKAVLNITAGTGRSSLSATLDITQRGTGDGSIIPSTYLVNISSSGKYPAVVEIETDSDSWSFENMPSDWYMVKQQTRSLVLTADQNTLTTPRTSELYLRATPDSEPVTVFVKQENGITISTSKLSYSFMEDGGDSAFTVTTNQNDWELVVPEGYEDWLTVNRYGNRVEFKVGTYDGYDHRQVTIGVKAGVLDEAITHPFLITQYGSNPNIMILSYTTPLANMEIQLPLDGYIECMVDWGDGFTEKVIDRLPTHTYSLAGTYTVVIDGIMTHMNSNPINVTTKSYLKKVMRWGLTGLTSMVGALENSTGITSLPSDQAGSFAEVVDFTNAFYECKGCTEIPEDIFKYATKAENFSYCFYTYGGNGGVKSIPEALFHNCPKAKNFEGVFDYMGANAAMTSIPEGLFSKCPEAETFRMAFRYFSKITEIPKDLFKYNTKVKNFWGCFWGCSSLTKIPAELFANCTEVEDFGQLFNYCSNTGLTIPAGLFDNCPKVTSFLRCFGNTKVTSIPAGLFDNCPEVTDFSYLFNANTALKSIPAGLFDKCTKAESFRATFYGCTGINTPIPNELFKYNTAATTFEQTFRGCTNITALPDELFNAPKVNSFHQTFYGCTKIASIGDNIFKNCMTEYVELSLEGAQSRSISGTFYNCTALTTVPEGLFDDCKYMTHAEQLFYGCSKLTTVPLSIFDKNRDIYSFFGTFSGCRVWVGESPYTVVEGIPIKLYERTSENGFAKITGFSSCFYNCTGLTDRSTIPSNWGGTGPAI